MVTTAHAERLEDPEVASCEGGCIVRGRLHRAGEVAMMCI
jgi:hypothetical protein